MHPLPLRLVLHSDQRGAPGRDTDRRLLAMLGVAEPTIGYVSAAPDPERMEFADRAAYYAGLGARLDAYIDEQSVCGRAIARLEACQAIHLSGGNTFTFAQWLRRGDLFEALSRYALRGGALIGVSAGAILLTASVASAALCGDVRPPEVVDDRGLSLVPFGFWPHFDAGAGRLGEASGLLRDHEAVYACPDGSAVFVHEGVVECIGPVQRLARDD